MKKITNVYNVINPNVVLVLMNKHVLSHVRKPPTVILVILLEIVKSVIITFI